MSVIRQNVGIDISKDDFAANLTYLLKGQIIKHVGHRSFPNTLAGFRKLLSWVKGLAEPKLPVSYTMEATGVYHEGLAFYLLDKNLSVHVLLPQRAKRFAESLNIKSKTDQVDACMLGHMGAERQLEPWRVLAKIYLHLRHLTRERERLIVERTRCKNQLHALRYSALPIKNTKDRNQNHIAFLNQQIKAIEQDMKQVIAQDDHLKAKIDKLISIPGVSFVTAAVVVAETNGFCYVTSIKQLISYAGYDIQIRQSGRYQGKSRISKKGNSHIRRAMYMPALALVRHSATYKRLYNNLNQRKQNGKVSLTAIQRRLLGLMYTLWKNDTIFVEDYEQKRTGNQSDKPSNKQENQTSGNDEPKPSFCIFAKQKTPDRQKEVVGECLPLRKIDFGQTNHR